MGEDSVVVAVVYALVGSPLLWFLCLMLAFPGVQAVALGWVLVSSPVLVSAPVLALALTSGQGVVEGVSQASCPATARSSAFR